MAVGMALLWLRLLEKQVARRRKCESKAMQRIRNSRKCMFRTAVRWFATILWLLSAGVAARAEPLTLRGTQFFVDDFIIDRMEGLAREFHPARKRGIVKGNDK